MTVSNTECVSAKWKKTNCKQDIIAIAVIACYYGLTTLSTIGYGDLYPISINEMFIGIILMLIGIIFFSQIMGSFIEIVQNYDQRMGKESHGDDLTNWMALLIRFTIHPLPESLINQVERHFSYIENNNRLNSITKDDEYLNQCPQMIKYHIMLNYLFDDVICRFRPFFADCNETTDANFLYDICFGLKPAKFDAIDDEKLILDEEDEVSDMYFIMEGCVGIGYYLMSQGLSKKQFKIGIQRHKFTTICDYYVTFNKNSEFIYLVQSNVQAISLSKRFLLSEVFVKYPRHAHKIKVKAEQRYIQNVREVLLAQQQKHIMEINKASPYRSINIRDKNQRPKTTARGQQALDDNTSHHSSTLFRNS